MATQPSKQIPMLTGTLVYVQVQQPKPCYEERKGFEYKASIVVSEDDAEQWDEVYPKQTAKQVKTSDFLNYYKIPAPFPSQRKQFVITVRKNTKLGNGDPVPEKYQPKVFEKVGSKITDVTKEKLPANGSLGQISVETFEGKMGVFARLKNVLVTEMIEYKKDDDGSGSEFGMEVEHGTSSGDEFSSVSGGVNTTPAKVATLPKKVVPESAVEDDMDDGIPF